MRTARVAGLGIIILGALVLMGCTFGVTAMGPGGVRPGGIVTNVTYPVALNPSMDYQVRFQAENIDIMDTVEAEAKSYNILGVVAKGDSGYGKLLERARLIGAAGVMNVTVDTKYFSILGVYTEVANKLTGQAYKYK